MNIAKSLALGITISLIGVSTAWSAPALQTGIYGAQPQIPLPPSGPAAEGDRCAGLFDQWSDYMNLLEQLQRDCQELDRQCRLIWNYPLAIFQASCDAHMVDEGCQGTSIYYWRLAEEARLAASGLGCGWAQ